MPKDLAALVVEDGAVPADAVERALARQRDAGGALDTALLEQGAIGEDALDELLARAAELPSAPASAWSGSDARARRVFPSRVAERHGLAPFALDGRELSLVATYPVDHGLLDEISFMLSLHLTAHVAPEWRVRELIHRLYGSPLPPRLAALAASSGAAPAAAAEPPPGAPGADATAPGADIVPRATRPGPPTAAAGFARDESEPLEPLAAALAQALESVESFAFEDLSPSEQERDDGEPEGDEPKAGGSAAGEPAPVDRTAPPRWTLENARAALADARHRDEVVLAALRYARDFFEFAAMFAVTRDAVAGHDALGSEEARDRARSVAIWSSDPGIFKTVIETQSPYLGPVAPGVAGTDAVLHGLGRAPRTVLVYPVLLRDRPVCILYADNGEAPVSARRLGDLLLFLSTVGGSFERIIRNRKKRPRRRAAVPAEVGRAHDAPPPSAAAAAPPRGPAAEVKPEPPAACETPPVAPEVTLSSWAAAEEPGPSAHAPERSGLSVADALTGLEDRSVASDPVRAGAPPAAAPPTEAAQPSAPPARAAAPVAGARAAAAPAPASPPVATPPDPATLAALADRALDGDPEVAAAACAALGTRRKDRALKQAAEKLRRALLSGISVRATRAARAIGALRDVEAIPLLIQALEMGDPETAQAAADALAAITLQRIGPNARGWLAWWKENRGRGRAEWLFSGLTSPDRETRVAASVELSTAAPPPVAYSADLPAAEREKAARAWAGWWSRSGHVL